MAVPRLLVAASAEEAKGSHHLLPLVQQMAEHQAAMGSAVQDCTRAVEQQDLEDWVVAAQAEPGHFPEARDPQGRPTSRSDPLSEVVLAN